MTRFVVSMTIVFCLALTAVGCVDSITDASDQDAYTSDAAELCDPCPKPGILVRQGTVKIGGDLVGTGAVYDFGCGDPCSQWEPVQIAQVGRGEVEFAFGNLDYLKHFGDPDHEGAWHGFEFALYFADRTQCSLDECIIYKGGTRLKKGETMELGVQLCQPP